MLSNIQASLKRQPHNPDLDYEDPDIVYESTSIKETVVGLMKYVFNLIYRITFFCCICTKKLCCGEKKEFVTGRTSLLKTMGAMEITEKEATEFFKLFEKIDNDHSGSIEVSERSERLKKGCEARLDSK